MLVDLRPKKLTGKVAEAALGRAHITCNKNGIPFDPEKPMVTSGVRLGTPAGTTRGFGVAEFRQVGELIAEVLDVLSQKGAEDDALVEAAVRDKVKRADRPVSDLSGLGVRGEHALSELRISLDTQVKDSRPTEDSAAIRRRRVCLSCNFRFTTFERVQLRELTVIKRNGRRVPFDRDKLMRSVQIALRKRPVEPERIEQMVSKIVRELESLGESEITSETIGEAVMEHLRELDDVAYVRFASVYRNFREAKDFEHGARRIVAARTKPSRRRSRANERRAPRERRERPPIPRTTALHGACAGARPARARPHLAQSGGRRGDRQGWRRSSAAAGRSPAAGRMPRPRRCERAGKAARGRDALRHARAVLASRQDAALRRRHHRGRHRARRLGAGRPQSGGRRRRATRGCARPASRSRSALAPRRRARDHAGHIRRMRDGRPHVTAQARGVGRRQGRARRAASRSRSPARRRASACT